MKVDRLVSIIMLLLHKERIGAQELADMFEVSLRTIYRDIEAINMAGIPIRSISGVGGGFEIMDSYKIDKGILTTEDLSAILMGLSNLSGMIENNELANALAKVRSFVSNDRSKEIELKASQIHIDLSSWVGNRNIQDHIETIKIAIQERKLLMFEYTGHHGKQTTRTVEPYQLVLKSSHWYFYGYCYERNDFRLFKLSRIATLQIKESFFTPREYQKLQLDATDIVAELEMRIKIRIHYSIMDRVLDYCSYEYFIPDGKAHYIVSFPFIDKDYYYDMLLSFGNKCECLEPPHIRAEMKRRIHEIASLYDET